MIEIGLIEIGILGFISLLGIMELYAYSSLGVPKLGWIYKKAKE